MPVEVMSALARAERSGDITLGNRLVAENLFQSRQLIVGTKQVAYRIYVPKDRKEGEKLPVMLYLHGSDERGDDNEGQLSGPAPAILANPNNFRFIMVFPQCPVGRFWDKE